MDSSATSSSPAPTSLESSQTHSSLSPPSIPPKSPKRKLVTVASAGAEQDANTSDPSPAPRPDPSSLAYAMSLSPSPTGQLPQLGFGSVYSFDDLVEADNRFLFRVYTPKSKPNQSEYQFEDPSDPYFLGYKFKEREDSDGQEQGEWTIPKRQRRLSSMSFSGMGTGTMTPLRRGSDGDSDSDTAVMSTHSWNGGRRVRTGSMSMTSSPFSRPIHHRSSSMHTVAGQLHAQDDIDALKTYESVARYMDWKTRSSSPYVSTTFSFAYALWDAVKRYKIGMKHDVEIAIIDARAVKGRAVTALELLRKANTKQKGKNYWQWYRFATEAQDVLVFGSIPGEAIYASVPLTSLLPKLPSYFFKEADTEPFSSISDKIDTKLFDHLVWEIGDSKRQRRLSRSSTIGTSPNDKYTAPNQTSQEAPSTSHRAFCQSVSSNFMQLPTSLRLGDSTTSATRLALAFLHPWFHARVHSDPDDAADVLTALALYIAHWPAEWWVRDRVGEVETLIKGAVRTMVEEATEGGALGVEIGEELKRLWEQSNNEERERVERSRAGTPGLLSRAPSPGPSTLLSSQHNASNENVATRPTTPEPGIFDTNTQTPLKSSTGSLIRPTSPSASPGIRSPTPSRRRGSISSPSFGFEHIRRPGSALSFRSELDHIPDVPGDVDSENRDARMRNGVGSRMGSLRARSPSPSPLPTNGVPLGEMLSMSPPGTPPASVSRSPSVLERRRSRLSQSFETDLGGSWTGSGSWSLTASAKYDGDSEGSGEAEGRNSGTDSKLARHDSSASTNGLAIGRGPRRISFADEADVKMLRVGSSGSGSVGEKSPGLGVAFGGELDKLPRQESIEEEDEKLEEKTLSSEKTATPQRQDRAASSGDDTEPEEPAPAVHVEITKEEEPVSNSEAEPSAPPEEIVENHSSSSESEKSTEPRESDLAGSSDSPVEAIVDNLGGVIKNDTTENDEPAVVEPAGEAELIYRESDRVRNVWTHTHASESNSEQSSAKSTLPLIWPWELLHRSTLDGPLDSYATSYDRAHANGISTALAPDVLLVGRHIHDIYGMFGGLLTAWIPAWASTGLMFLLGLMVAYVALIPQTQANYYW